MRARRGLISSSFLILLLPLILISCSGGGSEAPPSLAPQPSAAQPPAPAGLILRRDNALIRSQTDGSGQVTLADEPAGISSTLVSGTNVVYTTPQIPPVSNMEDIWTVQTNGTDRHLVVHDAVHETHLSDVIGPWVLYTYRPGLSFSPPPPSLAGILLTGVGSRIIMAATGQGELWQQPNYERQVGGRALIEFAGNLFSLLPDGTDLRQITFYPPYPHFNEPFTVWLGTRGVVEDKAIYSVIPILEEMPKLFAVPVGGGSVVQLGTGLEYEILGAIAGSRVIYNRCVLVRVSDPAGGFNSVLDQCDVVSVLSDGQGRVALTSTRDINYIQGAIGQQIIVRRSQRGGTTDSLFSIPGSGGVETPMLLLSAQNDFVSGIVADRVILRRPTGLWSIKADGSGLVQLTADTSDWFSGSTGPFACFTRGSSAQHDLWCVPADGSGLATQVDTGAYFVSGL